jgi:hypothetical protein
MPIPLNNFNLIFLILIPQQGDLCRIIDVIESRDQVQIRMVPRIDLTSSAKVPVTSVTSVTACSVYIFPVSVLISCVSPCVCSTVYSLSCLLSFFYTPPARPACPAHPRLLWPDWRCRRLRAKARRSSQRSGSSMISSFGGFGFKFTIYVYYIYIYIYIIRPLFLYRRRVLFFYSHTVYVFLLTHSLCFFNLHILYI